MKYLYVEREAVVQIVANRNLQSCEFEEGLILANFISEGQLIENYIVGDLCFLEQEDGIAIFSKNATSKIKEGVIFDLTTFKGFHHHRNRKDLIVTLFQKVLKFAIRYWRKLPLTNCEKNIVDSDYSLVFPFPALSAIGKAYRVFVDRNLNKQKLELSEVNGQFLLVFGDGHDGKGQVEPNYSIAKDIVREVANLDLEVKDFITAEHRDNQKMVSFSVTELNNEYDTSISTDIGFEMWNTFLTKKQSDFVQREVNGPERLQGAAGTGKTLIMILRCINILQKEIDRTGKKDILFITHSVATKRQIINIFERNWPESKKYFERNHSSINLTITTLQELCITYLGRVISETEYLDKDAEDSKVLQRLYLEETLDELMKEEFDSFKSFCSDIFLEFIEKVHKEELLEMLQQEIAVTIKGRAAEDIDKYKTLPRLKYSIPVAEEGDLNFIYLIYQRYQDKLGATGQFDSDDIILSALGRFNTPIWRRRRKSEGYDMIFIDETHLFNFNELSIFHHLQKQSKISNIVFAIDKSQAIGDRGLSDEMLFESLNFNHLEENLNSNLKTVFRSSPNIVNLAFNILSSGATLFTNFENPLQKVEFSFTEEQERKSKSSKYYLKENDETLVIEGINMAEKLRKELDCPRSKILIVSTTPLLLQKIENHAKKKNKGYELLKQRGDMEVVKHAEKSNRFVIAGIDYVGGLEFDGVVIIGVDKGRVPPIFSTESCESYHFINYSWHNRLYVATTRAKYAVVLYGSKVRGVSPLLKGAIENNVIEIVE